MDSPQGRPRSQNWSQPGWARQSLVMFTRGRRAGPRFLQTSHVQREGNTTQQSDPFFKTVFTVPRGGGKKKKQVKSWGQAGWCCRYFPAREGAEIPKTVPSCFCGGLFPAACAEEGHAQQRTFAPSSELEPRPKRGSEPKLEKENYKCMTSSGAGKASDYLPDHTIKVTGVVCP